MHNFPHIGLPYNFVWIIIATYKTLHKNKEQTYVRKVVYLGLDYEIMFCSRRCDSCVRVFARATRARLQAAAVVAVQGAVK